MAELYTNIFVSNLHMKWTLKIFKYAKIFVGCICWYDVQLQFMGQYKWQVWKENSKMLNILVW